MEAFSQICVVVVLGAICALVLRRHAPEMSFALSMLLALAAGVFGIQLLEPLLEFINQAAEMAELPQQWLTPVYKAVGIAVLAKLSGDLIRDTGQTGAASAVELAGVLASLTAALPLLQALLSLLDSLARAV